jgi:hypothetical protein
MSNDLQNPTGRIVWQDGQVLASRDLRADLQDEARHRRLHNRYLHATWGITFGFPVTLDSDGARVIVSPGYAIDSSGGDLLLANTMMVAPPAANGTFILVASYSTGSCRPSLPDTDFCVGLDPRRERAAIGWVADADINFGPEVPLVRATFASGKVQGDLDSRVRRYARRMVRPHIGYGVTKAGNSNWADVSVPTRENFWLQVTVDTSEAGFVNTPRYLATLSRQNPARKKPRAGSLNEAALLLGTQPALTLDGIGDVVKAGPGQFTYRVPRGSLPFGIDLTAVEAETAGWVVAWVGIEQPAEDQLSLDLGAIFAALGAIL